MSRQKQPHPKLVGDRTTAHVLARLLSVYDSVLLPFGENQRYDLLVEDGDRFLRIQCKTGRLRNGVIKFAACSVTFHHPNRSPTKVYRHPYRGQADYFAVYCPETQSAYLVPVEDVGLNQGSLRIDPPENGQSRGIRWATAYEISPRKGATRPRLAPVASRKRGPSSTGSGASGTLFESPARYAVN